MPIMSSPSPAAFRAAHRLHHEWLKCGIPISPDGIAAIIEADLSHERAELIEALRACYTELNIICARDGVPYCHDGLKSDVEPAYFQSVVDKTRALLARYK
jgi:hypothetical protein